MCVQAIQNGLHNVWAQTKPYMVPVALAGGVALVVNLVWGNIATACFVVVAGAIGLKYPSFIKVIDEDNPLINLTRLVLIVVLPYMLIDTGSRSMTFVAGVIVSIGISMMTLVSNQTPKIEQATNRIVTAVAEYSDTVLRREEQREVLGVEALLTMPKRLDEANHIVQHAVRDQEQQVQDHLHVVSDIAGHIEQFRANVDGAKQFTNDLRGLNQRCDLIILLQEDVAKKFDNLRDFLGR